MKRRVSVTNFSSENNFSRHQGKIEEVRTNTAINSHALFRIHVIGDQRSLRIVPPSLPPHHSEQLFHHLLLAGMSVFLQSRLRSPSGHPNVDLATAAGDKIYHIGLFTKR